jgi:regulator of replication initiation timing
MSTLKLKQLQYESDACKHLLGCMMDENVHLKNRLSEVLMDNFDNEKLQEAEFFLNSFVKEDYLIGLLRHDVVEVDKMLTGEIFENGLVRKEVLKKIKNMRTNIRIADRQFRKMKADFDGYLSQNIQ